MGQAKNRKNEIATLKASVKTINITAIRHHKSSVNPEIVAFNAEVIKPRNDKNALLRHICLTTWGHNAPVAEITEYLLQTQSYGVMKMVGNADHMVIHFYESDEDRPGTHSCRQVYGLPTFEAWKEHTKELIGACVASGEYDVAEVNAF